MSIIDDWLRQWPNLTLTRDQRQTLEELIDEETEEAGDLFGCGDTEDDDIAHRVFFTRGAKAMRLHIAETFKDEADANSDDPLGLKGALGCIAERIEKIETPEPEPEDLEDEPE